MAAQPAVLQVHDQEREIVEHVDAGDGVVELDGVEDPGPAVDDADVAQVQIAMAAAHEAGRQAPVEQRRVAFQRRARGARESGDVARREEVGARAQLAQVLLDHRAQAGRAAARGRRRVQAIGAVVEGRDLVGERGHQLGRQAAGPGQAVAKAVLVEALHDHQPFDRLARSTERQPAVGAAHHRLDAEIELGRGAPVERDLALAVGLAQGQGGEIHVGVAHGALHLVGAVAR